jgi:ketopantoate reductase
MWRNFCQRRSWISYGRRGSDTRNTASGAEAVRTALALGHRLVPIFGKSRVEVNDPEAYAKSLMDAVLSGWTLPDTRVAVPQDWMKGRRGEVDDINGLVAREQRRLGGRAPVNEKLVENSHKDRKPSANGRSFERRSFAVAAPGLTREQALNS